MARLIAMSPYIKGGTGGGGGAGGYLKYIGTREGVELLPAGYMEYMAERPRSHGLFGDEDNVDMNAAMEELNEYPGNIWTHVISLKREDAERLGYDHAPQWRNLIRAHRNEIAAAMNIPPSDFRWYAAFHDEGDHPHIHMMAWSAKPGQAYLSKDGIRKIKSALTNDIFKQEMLHTYEQKSSSRDELVRKAREEMKALAQEMQTSLGSHPEVESLMMTLVSQLESVTGMLTGALLVPTAYAAVRQLTATPSTQRFYVDGKQTQLEAYSINGGNYVKLRDVGKAVGFQVGYDGSTNSVYIGEQPLIPNSDTVTIPTDGSKYIPKTGDRVRCDDGYIYEVKDVSRYDNNVFAEGPVGPLPTPTCDWSAFPEVEVPRVEVRHFAHDDGDSMFIRNIYETRRMQYTIYNAIGREPGAWRNGKPLMTIALTIDPANEPWVKASWPWRASDMEDLVHSRPNSHYYVEAWDYYSKGIFQYTRYCVASL